MYHRSGGEDPGRDGCRVPLPWSGDQAPFGFSPPDAEAEPWLDQPAHWATLTAEAQLAEPGSMLNLYRTMLRLRRSEPGLRCEELTWLPAPEDVIAFARGAGFMSISNLSTRPVTLPAGATLLLASSELVGGDLPVDATAWLRPPAATATASGGGGG